MRRKNIAILLGSGQSERMKMQTYKQFVRIQNRYLYEYCIDNFLDVSLIDSIILVVNEDYADKTKEYIKSKYKKIHVCAGAQTRKESLDKAINYVKELFYKELNNINIITHDVARIFVSRKIIEEHIKSLDTNSVVNTIFPLDDSIVMVEDKVTKGYPNRSLYYSVQTPQSFRLDKYIVTNFKKIDSHHEINDVVKMFYLNNYPIYNIIGEKLNFKITYPSDLKIAEAIIKKWVEY